MGARRAGHPARHADVVEEPDAVRAGRVADLPGAGPGRPRLGRRRQRVRRLPDGARPGAPRLRASPSSTTPSARQLDDGITFTLMHPLEVEVAERIVALCPGVETVRFGKSGSDAVDRRGPGRARHHRPRPRARRPAITAGTTGTSARPPATRGVPAAVRDAHRPPFRFDDLDALDERAAAHDGEVAAVVLEPSGADDPAPGYLQGSSSSAARARRARRLRRGHHRLPLGARRRPRALRRQPRPLVLRQGPRQRHADLRRRRPWAVMGVFEEIFFSGTHGGEALSLAAAARRARHDRRRHRALGHSATGQTARRTDMRASVSFRHTVTGVT